MGTLNPFAWTGPTFLAFYVVLAVAVTIVVWVVVKRGANTTMARVTDLTSDPYRIACLRGRRREAIRVAIFNLVDRGLLVFFETRRELKAVRSDAAGLVRRPLDRAILAACARGSDLGAVMRTPLVLQEAGKYETELARMGLVVDPGNRNSNAILAAIAGGFVFVVALVKIGIAIPLGRPFAFLLILMLLATGGVVAMCVKWATPAGKRLRDSVETLLARLKGRVETLRAGGEDNEALLVAATFGMTVLPELEFPFLEGLFPKRNQSSTSSCGTSSSCGSGGGGSCGGGGGCGGCGS
jgi:uncharacterized protein (TIGR04222 family)